MNSGLHSLAKRLLIASLLATTGAGLASAQPTFLSGEDPKPAGKVWRQVPLLSDEFEGASLDATKWQSEPVENGWGWYGRAPGLFRAENVAVRDGKMNVTVSKLEAPVMRDGKRFTHQGAIVRSLHPGRPGWYYECRMKANATVMSSTFWLVNKPGSRKHQELDIQECVGLITDKTERWAKKWDRIFHSNLIDWDKKPKKEQLQGSVPTETKNSERFYVYGAWWKSQEEVQFFLDGKCVYSIKPKVAWDASSFIQMAVEIYDWNPVPEDGGLVETGTQEERTTQYDWVRTWELADEGATSKDTVPAVRSEATIEGHPNILYIMADDHTTQAFGCYGSQLAKLNPTPTLDRLAAEGMRFDRVFCVNSICTPSRATILTGQYPQSNGVLDLDGKLPPERQYLPQEMKKAGYLTAMIGKWHLEEEPASFDYYCVLPGQGKYFNPDFIVRGPKPWPKNRISSKGHSSDVITDLTIDWLEKRDKTKPFFLMHHYKAPHDMFEYAPRYESYLADVEIPEPANLYDQPAPGFGSVATRGPNDSLVHRIGTSVSKRHPVRNYGIDYKIDPSLDDYDYTHRAYQEYLKHYLRCVKGVDDNLARLFDYLKKNGLWENTVIIYTADQGMMLGEHDYIDKRWMYEESMRMPFIVHYPKLVKPGTASDLLINNTDFAPTMLALAGVKAPDIMQGHSFEPALEGKTIPGWRTATYYRYWMHLMHHDNPAHFGLRTADYKLIFYYGLPYDEAKYGKPSMPWLKNSYKIEPTPPAWEFYDLRLDPYTSDPPLFSVQAHPHPHVRSVFPARPENGHSILFLRPAVNAGPQKTPEPT